MGRRRCSGWLRSRAVAHAAVREFLGSEPWTWGFAKFAQPSADPQGTALSAVAKLVSDPNNSILYIRRTPRQSDSQVAWFARPKKKPFAAAWWGRAQKLVTLKHLLPCSAKPCATRLSHNGGGNKFKFKFNSDPNSDYKFQNSFGCSTCLCACTSFVYRRGQIGLLALSSARRGGRERGE